MSSDHRRGGGEFGEAFAEIDRRYGNPGLDSPQTSLALQDEVRPSQPSRASRASRASRRYKNAPPWRGPSGGRVPDGDGHDDEPLTTEVARLPPFPLEALPSVVRTFVEKAAVSLQADPGALALVCLGCLSAAALRGFDVEIVPGYACPLALDVMVVADPGEQKSAICSIARAPLDAWQARARTDAEAAKRQHKVEVALAKRVSKASDGERARAALERIEELEATSPGIPTLTTNNATNERLAALLEENRGSLAIIDGEGAGPLSIVAGRYSRGIPDFSIWCKGFDGEVLDIQRQARPSLHVSSPSLSLLLMVQPIVLQRFGAVPGSRGQGVLGRFVFAVPSSMAGRCDWERSYANPVSPSVRQSWEQIVTRLLDVTPPESGRHRARLSEAAQRRLVEFRTRLEPRRGEDGDLRSIGDWAAKHVGILGRIAALMALAELAHEGRLDDSPVVEVRHLEAAFALSPYLCAHAHAALGIASEEPTAAILRDPMLRVLVDLVPRDEPLVATCEELIGLITEVDRRSVVGVGARSMATRLRKARPLLRRVGIEIRTPDQGRGRQGRREYTFTRTR